MAINYAGLRDSFSKIIQDNGRTVSIVKRNTSHADPSKPWRAGSSPDTSKTVYGVIVPFEAKDVDGQNVKVEDQRMIISADSSVDFTNFDTVIDGSNVWRIIKVSKFNPGSVSVAFDLQLRR